MKAIKEIELKSALHRLHSRFLPYNWDLNIYRGCSHHCQYCYALYSHRYLDDGFDFFKEIYVKTNVVEHLARELAASTWKKEIVNMGGVTDSYQKIEEKYQIMPEVLKLMIKHETPIIISTKSDLILRDFDLLCELAEKTYVNVALTITTTDEELQNKIEPGAVSPDRRFKVLDAFKNTKVNTGLHFMPILPYLTDSEENMEDIFANAADAKVDYLLNGVLNLRGETRFNYFRFLQTAFPEIYPKYLKLYNSKNHLLWADYRRDLYERLYRLKSKHGLSSAYNQVIKQRLGGKKDNEQMELF